MNKISGKSRIAIFLTLVVFLAACAPEAQGAIKQAVPGRAIQALYQQLGAEKGVLGASVSNDLEEAGNGWVMWHYGCGRIYSNPKTGTYEVYGPILNEWQALLGEDGPIGYPTGHPEDALDAKGKRQTFQNAILFWSGSGPVEVFASLENLKRIEKARMGLRR